MVFFNTNFTYDANGNLFCIICKSIIKSSAIWKVHVNSKLHKLNVEKAKAIDKTTLGKKFQNKVNPPEKTKPCFNVDKHNEKKKNAEQSKQEPVLDQNISGLPENTETLPEMFFDNPVLHTKTRQIENKNNFNDEWERFQLEMKETVLANKLISGEQKKTELDREITEISEQMQQWTKVIKLENKLQTISKKEKLCKQSDETDENLSDDEVNDFLDWRSKKFT